MTRQEYRMEKQRFWVCKHCGNTVTDPWTGLKIERIDKTMGFTRIGGRRRCNKCLEYNGR